MSVRRIQKYNAAYVPLQKQKHKLTVGFGGKEITLIFISQEELEDIYINLHNIRRSTQEIEKSRNLASKIWSK